MTAKKWRSKLVLQRADKVVTVVCWEGLALGPSMALQAVHVKSMAWGAGAHWVPVSVDVQEVV